MPAPSLSEKLAQALPYHYKEGQKYRTARAEILRDYAGRTTHPGYGEESDDREKQIVNLTFQAAEAFTMNLAASRPRFMCTSRYPEHEASAAHLSRALDRYAEELYLEEVLQDITRDSFASVGIAKVYQAESAAVNAEADYRMDPGRPFLGRVSLDRLVWDTAASSPHEASFIGDKYTMEFEKACGSSRFTKKARAKLREIGPEKGSRLDQNMGEDLARSQNSSPIEDLVYLVDVFIRQKMEVWTFVCEKDLNLRLPNPIQKVKWKGEECGPYYLLNMGPIPDHFMPASPAQNLKLLNQLTNTLYRKIEDQCRRQKSVIIVDQSDGDTVRDMQDGEIISLNNPQAVVPMRLDGADSNMMGAAMHFDEQHSQAAGNRKHKLGLAPSADTATQERMIGAMSSRLEAFYQQRYVSFVRKAARGLAKLIYHDANLTIPGTYTVPGTEYQVSDDWLPYGEEGAREGHFDYYKIDIDPYSMGYQSPAERIAIMDQDMAYIATLYPILVQQGVQLNFSEVFAERARLRGMDILNRMLKFNQPPLIPQGGGMSAGGSMDPNKGHYTHTSQSTRGPESQAMQLMQAPQQGAA